jgi:hypothetical protein
MHESQPQLPGVRSLAIVQQTATQNRAGTPWVGQVLLILFGFPLACAACGALYGLAFAFVDWYFTGHGEALTILPHRLAIGGTIMGLPFGVLSAIEVMVLALGRGGPRAQTAGQRQAVGVRAPLTPANH